MGRRRRQIRDVLDRQFTVVVLAMVVLSVVGAGVAYGTYVEPGSHVEQRQGPSAEYTGAYSHEATVQQANPVFPVGQTLVDRSFYYTSLAPVLNGTFTYTYTATDGGELDAEASLQLVARSVGQREDQTVEYWRTTRQLDRASATLAPDEELTVSFSENVSEIANETERIDEQLGGTPGTIRTTVVAVVETDGRVNGRAVDTRRQYELGIVPEEGIYRVESAGPVRNVTEQTREVTVQNTYGLPRKAGGPLLLLVGLAGLSVLALARYRGVLALSEAEREYLTYETTRAEFDDWITTASIPEDALEGPVVEVADLEGLVDVAIDSDRRVIEDVHSEQYVVTVEDRVYLFRAPLEPVDTVSAGDVLGVEGLLTGQNGDSGTGSAEEDDAADADDADDQAETAADEPPAEEAT